MLKSSNKSEIAVLKVELQANNKGYHVSLPKNQASRYDLIIDDGEKLYRTQIKYVNRFKHGKKTCIELLIDKDNLYTNTQIDLLLIYCPAVDSVLCFPPELFHNKKTIWINLVNPDAPTFYKKFLW